MMNFDNVFRHWWLKNEPASSASLDNLQKSTNRLLPVDYVRFLKWSNGGEGDTGTIYITLWRAEELVKRNNLYGVQVGLPEAIAFGDYGSSMFIFDKENRVFRKPFGNSIDETFEELAPNFEAFIECVKRIEP